MRLKLENAGPIDEPNDAAIADALATLHGDSNSFAILSRTEMTYIQTAGSADNGLMLEYQEGSTDAHYTCTDESLSLARVTKTFQQYARGDNSWKQGFEWMSQPVGRTGCLGAIVLLTMGASALACALWLLRGP